MRNIAVAGTGYVGLSTGTCFADMGNNVTCIDISEEKINMLLQGQAPIYEPGLNEMIVRNVKGGRLHFTTDYDEALQGCRVRLHLRRHAQRRRWRGRPAVCAHGRRIGGAHMTHSLIVINKSTVPVGTGDWVADIVRAASRNRWTSPWSVARNSRAKAPPSTTS